MSNNQQTPEPKPAPYEWIYAEIDGYQRCIGLIQGNRDVMIATGDGQSSWLDFAPTAKTMILRAIERARQPLPADLSALDREALARNDGPCAICGELTDSRAGAPSRWPLHFPEPDEPGVKKPHHEGCVMERLRERDGLAVQLAVARAEVERLKSADNPEYDATDAASPAWWRGHDHTTKVFCALVNDILDGKDDSSGANREPWASTRKRLLGLRAEITRMSQEIARLEGEFVEVERELEVGKDVLISHGYEENELRFMLDELFEIVGETQAVMLKQDAEIKNGVRILADFQARLEGQQTATVEVEADNSRLRAVLAQVGEAVKARAVEIASYANGREDAGSYIAAEIESIDIAAIGAASAPDNAISQAPANSDTLAALTERILNLKSYLDNAPNIELDTSNVRALVDNLAAIVAPGAETTNALRSDPTRPCCPECNEEKNLAYLQTNAEAEEWECRTCRTVFQFKPPAEKQEGDDGKD